MAAEDQLREYLKKATVELREARRKLRELQEGRSEPVAIVGMGCRLPGGAASPEALWELVSAGRDAVSAAPRDRGWDLDPDLDQDLVKTAMGGFLEDGADFDPAPFRLGRAEALAMDPQHRLLLETAWEAVERARIDPAALAGSRTGVYIGLTQGSYARGLEASAPGAVADHLAAGNVANTAAGRLAHIFDLAGPALTVDTACSSSLVALHLAVRALRGGECDVALVGGAAFMARPDALVDFGRREGLASDGRCKAFGAGADGVGFAEGAGVLVLQTLESARRSGRPVLALVAGTAVAHDGATNGLGAPSAPAQRRVIAAALADAGLRPGQVDAVEAHGTGTSIGDAAEATALVEEYGIGRDRPLYVGTVKSNIGHTQAAGGIAAVVKTVQALHHGWLPRTLHADPPSPYADWSSGSVSLLTQPMPWPRTGEARRAGVSSFGASGTNAHVVLAEAPAASVEAGAGAPQTGNRSRGWTVWPLSARSDAAVRALASRLLNHLDQHPDVNPADVGRSLATTRTAFAKRTAIVAATAADFRAGLAMIAASGPLTTVVRPAAASTPPADVADAAERYARGEAVAWDGLFEGAALVDLPTYPFQRERFWLTPAPRRAAAPAELADIAGDLTELTRPEALTELAQRDPASAAARAEADLIRLAGELLEATEGELSCDGGARFSEIGLDSVRAVRLRRRLAAEWGADVPLDRILGRATVAELARTVLDQLADPDATRAASEPAPLVPRPDERHEPFPLTDVQHAYWIGRSTSVELGGIATNFYVEFDRGEADLARLELAWQRVVERHEMLRAVVDPDGRQRILPEVPAYRIAVRELAENADAELAATREEMTRRLAPADQWPLFDVRMSVLSVGDSEPARRCRIHVCVDMLLLDGASLMLVLDDWRRFYEEPDWQPEPLALSFRDVVLAEARQAADEGTRKAEEYWLGRLDTLPPAPALPLATTPAQVSRPEFRRRVTVLEPAVWSSLTSAARRHGVTPSAVLMTAFSDVLRAWSGQDALTLNLTLFNRPPVHPQVEDVAGDFTSLTMLAVEPDPEPGAGFGHRAERLHGQLLRDLDHAAFSGVKVLRERARRLGGRPGALMPVVFTSLLGVGGGTEEHADFFGEVVHAGSQTPQVWLDHVVSEDRGRLVLNWYSAEALFPDGLLDDMFAAYVSALHRLAGGDEAWAEPDPAAGLPAWQADERTAANATDEDIPARTLYDLVRERAEAVPGAVAVIGADGRLTYGDLLQRAHRLGHALRDLGAVPGELVGVLLDKGCDQVAAVLGVAASGAAYLPIDPGWPPARRDELLGHCRTGLVVTSEPLAAGTSWPVGIRALTVTGPDAAAADADAPENPPAPEDLAYVIFTSGSTGRPKGVMIDHRGAANTVQDISRRFEVTADDRVLALSSLGFDLSVYDIFGMLAAGGTVVLPHPGREHDPAHWADLVTEHGVTLWNSVPALLQAYVDSRPGPAPLRLALLSGDWIPVTLPDAFRALFPGARVISLGGATEASIWSIFHPIGEVPPEWTRVPYGKPLANQTMHVLDAALRDCPVWTVGEIHIGGIGVALGYWADARQSAERFVRHPQTGERLYKTGDLGRYVPGGDIDLLGRNDFQVKLNGYRIELDEIAAALRRQPGVAEALVTLATNDRTGRRALAAYLIAEPGAVTAAGSAAGLDPAALRRGLEDLLPEYMVPHHYTVLDRFPLSANGKIDRGRLPSPWDGLDGAERTEPRDELEAALFAIWQEALGHGDFGVEDNFFELGGDSLHGVRILGAIRAELGVDAGGDGGLELLFDNPTVASLAAVVRGLR